MKTLPRATPVPGLAHPPGRSLLISFLILTAALSLPHPALSFSFGPPDGLAGNPPYYEDCTTCHFDHEVNSGDGVLAVEGLLDEYEPGRTYSLTVRLADPGQRRWGFELTVLDDADPSAQGGQLIATDSENTQLSEDYDGTVDYLKQTSDGSYMNTPDGPVRWDFDWTAPDASIPGLTFYVAGNGADGDASYFGDYIYTRSYTLTVAVPSASRSSTWGRIKALYRR